MTQNVTKERISVTAQSIPEDLEALYEKAGAWGLSCSIDLYECDPETIRDAEKVKQFVHTLCDEKIKMRRFGECQVVDFGDDPRVSGFSMTQLIETSLVSGHFANESNAVYLDVFSCTFYDPRVVAEFAQAYFGAERSRINWTLRL